VHAHSDIDHPKNVIVSSSKTYIFQRV